jgi:hypothetical protein
LKRGGLCATCDAAIPRVVVCGEACDDSFHMRKTPGNRRRYGARETE